MSAKTILDIDPSTGETLAEIPMTPPAELAAAVERARAAQPAWAARPLDERLACLERAAARIEERAEELALAMTREMGKPITSSRGEANGQAKNLRSELEELRVALAPESFGDDGSTQVVRAPHGVVAAIAPWNFPVAMPLSMLTPALGAGNTVVFKPSEHVPDTGRILAECLQAELPPGVLELVQGDGEVGAALVASPIDMIAFVGSRDVGRRIMAAASGELKRLVLELGGKDPLVVFADADLDAAAECAVRHSLRNTGQVCCSVERVYVAREVAEEFEERVLAKAREWRAGDPLQEDCTMGPMVSTAQRERVERQVREAVEGGARLLLGGECPDGPGAFYPATVLADVAPSQAVASEETFGPVVCLATFDGSEDEGVRLANDTPYGLGASLYIGDPERGARLAARIHAGQVGVNRYLAGAPGTPWVGARQSGFGFLGGLEGHRQFTVPKTISIAPAGK